MTGPIGPEDLADLQAAIADHNLGGTIDMHDAAKLITSHEWHRARVQVTDEDIRRVGLGGQHDQLIKWCKSNGVEVQAADARPRGQGAWLAYLDCPACVYPWVVQRIARMRNRPPLDVLDEIAAAGEWTWRSLKCATACHAELDGLVFRGVQGRKTHGMPGEAQECLCVAEPKP